MCVLMDASDKFWAGIMSRVDPNKPKIDPELQEQEPLAFVGGQFNGA